MPIVQRSRKVAPAVRAQPPVESTKRVGERGPEPQGCSCAVLWEPGESAVVKLGAPLASGKGEALLVQVKEVQQQAQGYPHHKASQKAQQEEEEVPPRKVLVQEVKLSWRKVAGSGLEACKELQTRVARAEPIPSPPALALTRGPR